MQLASLTAAKSDDKKKFLILAPLFRKKETEKPKVVPEKPQETLRQLKKTEESVPKTVQKLLNQLLRKPLFQNLVFCYAQ